MIDSSNLHKKDTQAFFSAEPAFLPIEQCFSWCERENALAEVALLLYWYPGPVVQYVNSEGLYLFNADFYR
jgi:hypothetical protein